MRGSKAKALRRTTPDARDREYKIDPRKTRNKVQRLLDGGAIHYTTHTVILDPQCGRAKYQQAKRSAA